MKSRILFALVTLLMAVMPAGWGVEESEPVAYVVWSDATVQPSAIAEAPPLKVYITKADGETVIARFAWQKAAGITRLAVQGQYLTEWYKFQQITLRNVDTGLQVSWTPTDSGAWADFGPDDLWIDVSDLPNGTTYEFEVILFTEMDFQKLKARRLAVVAVE